MKLKEMLIVFVPLSIFVALLLLTFAPEEGAEEIDAELNDSQICGGVWVIAAVLVFCCVFSPMLIFRALNAWSTRNW